jgi:hypothetical protein
MTLWFLADGDSSMEFEILVCCGAAIVLCAIGFFLAKWLRKRLLAKSDASEGTGFTLGDLRELHRSGKMSTEEFEKARALIVAAAKRSMPTNASGKVPTKPTDR